MKCEVQNGFLDRVALAKQENDKFGIVHPSVCALIAEPFDLQITVSFGAKAHRSPSLAPTVLLCSVFC